MKIMFFVMVFFIYVYADFTLTYKIDNRITQIVNYSDSKHVLFTIQDNNTTIEKLLIKDDKKYIIFNEDGIQHIYEISDELSEPIKETNTNSEKNYTILKKGKKFILSGFKSEKWRVSYSEKNLTTDVTVSNDPKIVNAIFKVMQALRELLPADKQEQANMFNMGNGYVILETGNLKLISYNDSKIALSTYEIDKTLNNEDEQMFSDNIQQCFTSVCCGEKTTDAKMISTLLNNSTKKWKLDKIAKCNNYAEDNIESAIYKNGKKTIVVEMTTSEMVPSGKIESLQKQGIKVENVKNSILDGFKITTAYLPIINATVSDIMLPNTTISIFSKGKKDLSNFAKKVLKLKIKPKYSTSSI